MNELPALRPRLSQGDSNDDSSAADLGHQNQNSETLQESPYDAERTKVRVTRFGWGREFGE